jgi:hypothetical protein
MIGYPPSGDLLAVPQPKRSFSLILILAAACCALPIAGCNLTPAPVRNVPAKIGLRSQEAELRAKVEADKFPTAQEAGVN